MASAENHHSGVINPDELYTLRTFKKRLNISDHTLRAARRAGLKVRYLHKQGYVLGRDWIEYVLNTSNLVRGEGPASVSQ